MTTPSQVTQAPAGIGEIPGLGRSESEQLRDEMISYWEVWKRGEFTRSCMSEAGFDWHVEALYTESTVIQLADHLNLPAVQWEGPLETPESLNQAFYSALDDADREAYMQALVGESAADMAYANENGHAPPGSSSDFAKGGCKGESQEHVGSFWDGANTIMLAWDERRMELRDSPEFAVAVQPYTACFADRGFEGVTGPWVVDQDPTAPGMSKAQRECNHLWDEANAHVMAAAWTDFAEENADEIHAQLSRYANAYAEATSDGEFLEFLAQSAALNRALPG